MFTIKGLVPNIGSRGKYILKSPWEANTDLIYRCERISSILDFKLSEEIDVLKDIYLDKGLTKEDYENAIKDNIKIVTLKSGSKYRIDVPDNYIEKFPDKGFVPYQQQIISINLGLLPNDINLTDTVEKIKELIGGTLNVKVNPLIHKYESERFIDWATHVEMEKTRESGVKDSITNWERIKKLEEENTALSAAVIELEAAMLSKKRA